MSQATALVGSRNRIFHIGLQFAQIAGATLLIALCAHISVPLPGTPVPLSLVNFAVILVGLMLGSRRGFAVLALYLAEGAVGLPVFSPVGAPGILRFLGPTAGYLIAYPFVAALAGYLFERGKATFARAVLAAVSAEVLLFSCGISWLLVLTHSLQKAIFFGLYWFIFAEIIKVMLAAIAASAWRKRFPETNA
jgi:biotin transport system substrate-specific component